MEGLRERRVVTPAVVQQEIIEFHRDRVNLSPYERKQRAQEIHLLMLTHMERVADINEHVKNINASETVALLRAEIRNVIYIERLKTELREKNGELSRTQGQLGRAEEHIQYKEEFIKKNEIAWICFNSITLLTPWVVPKVFQALLIKR